MPDNVAVEFVSTSILRIHEFSWVFLVDWIMIMLLVIFAIFYFNQLLGFVVTHTVGWYVWHRYNVYFKVEAVQISLFAGRVMFSNVVYIGTSEAVRIVHGSIGWRYWIRNRRRSAFVGGSGKGECALVLKIRGFEWFVYNREYAYDVLGKSEPPSAELARGFEEWQQNLSSVERRFSHLMPMHVDARNIAFVFGNDETESLVVMSAPSAKGVVDMDAASNEVDRYSFRINMQVEMPEIELRKNPDYEASSIDPGQPLYNKERQEGTAKKPRWVGRLKNRHKKDREEPWMGLRRYMEDQDADAQLPLHAGQTDGGTEYEKRYPSESPAFPASPSSHDTPESRLPYVNKYHSRSTSDPSSTDTRIFPDTHSKSSKTDEKAFNSGPLNPAEVRQRLAALPTEYAKVSQVLACDRLDVSIIIDVVGPVNPTEDEDAKYESEPLHSISLRLYESKLNYGPWTERQRQQFWSFFFPRQCVDAKVPGRQKPGELRLQKRSILAVELLGESICVVPVREKSKDGQFAASFAKNFGTFGDDIQRNYGWVELRVLEGSSISMIIPFIPGEDGFTTECHMSFQKPEVRSSVTHDTMFYASQHHLSITQRVPLIWNALQTWDINNSSNNMDFYVLREHITLLADMINDFADGPATPYVLFVPIRYKVTWQIVNLALFLNVNKNNIINKPTSRSENTFIELRAPLLEVDWDLPSEEISAPTSASRCLISAAQLDVQLNAPNWHTLQSFLDSQRMARIDNFEVQWSMFSSSLPPENRFAESEPEVNRSRYVDTQVIDIKGSRLALIAYGFFIDYAMRVRENYFGHAYHFQTTEEFLQRRESEQHETFEFSRADLDMDAHVHVQVDEGVFVLPQYLYSAKDSLGLYFTHFAMDSRFTNYYMDLQAEFEPVVGRLLRGLQPDTLLEVALDNKSGSILSISQLEIRAHRMFGLPPSEPTYVVKWDFDVGDISLNADTTFLETKQGIARSFHHGFSDDENKPILLPEELYDVTFVSANVASIFVTLRPAHVDDVSVEVEVGPVKMRFNDLANLRYSGRATLEVPLIQTRCYTSGVLALEASTAVYVTKFLKKHHAEEHHAKQQAHIALHDTLFHRAPFLLEPEVKNSEPYTRERQFDDLRPCIALLPFSPPLTRETIDMLAPLGARYNERQASGDSENGSDFGGTDSGNSTPGTSLYGSVNSSDTVGSMKNSGVRSQTEIPEVYPFASSEATTERQRLRRQRTNFHLHATTWRQNAPTLPDDDDDYEHSSTVVQFTAVTVSVTPKVVALVTALDVKPDVSFEAELDALQFNIVKALGKGAAAPEHTRMHVVIPVFTLHLSERLHSVHGLLCEVKDIDVMLGSRETQRGIHAEINSLSVAFRRGGATIADLARINAASVVLSKVVFWWSELNSRKGTGGLDFAGVDVSAATDQVEWTILYAAELAAALASSSKRRESPSQRPKTMSAMFYALTMAGEQMGVEQDSYVLSRPSGAIQSRSHVRSQISWRIVMRLRYLLQHISQAELAKLQRDVARGRFQLPQDARQRMLRVYRRWRSWEQSDNLEDSEIFKQVMQDQSFQEYVLSMSTRLALSTESMVVRLVYPDMREHYLGLDTFVIHLVSTRMNETQNLSITLRCSKMRAFGGINLVLVAADIISAVAQAEDAYQEAMEAYNSGSESDQLTPTVTDEDEFVMQSPADDDAEMPQQSATDDGLALQASVSMFLLDLVLEFDLETVKIETQNHQVQFTASVELMQTSIIESLFHTGVLATSNGAFRIFKPGSNQDILDSLLTEIHVGYASRGPSERSNSWATVSIGSLSLAVHPTTPELAKLVVEFLDTELPVLKRVGETLVEASARRVRQAKTVSPTHSRSASITSLYSRSNEVGAGQYVNFSVSSIKVRFALVDDLRLVLQGKNVEVKLRHTDALVGSFELERGTLGVHYGENLASVAKIQIEAAKAVGRVDQQVMAIAMINDVGALRMETMSVVWLLEYLSHRKLESQIGEVVDAVNEAMELVRDVAPKHGEEGESNMSNAVEVPDLSSDDSSATSKTAPKFRMRIISRIREISVVLPLDTSSFKLTLAEITAKLENFKTLDELNQNAEALPQNISVEVADLALVLSLPHHVSREMLRLQFSVDARQENKHDTFNVQSDYVRFAIDPEAVGALFVALDKLDQHTRALFRTSKQLAGGAQPTAPAEAPLKPLISTEVPSEKKKRLWLADLQRLRVNLLLKSLTITWYTGPSSQHGIVLGYERLEVRVAELFAQLELAGTYITPVVPRERQGQAMSERANTAYLPLVDAKLFVTEKNGEEPCVHVSMSGRSVTLLITSSVAPWILKLLDSWEETRHTINGLAAQRLRSQSSRSPSDAPPSPSTPQKLSSFHVPFGLRMDMHFDRGILRVFEEQVRSGDPALELFSPAVGISAEYAKNRLLLLVDVSPTSNKVYPKAVSELKAFSSQLTASLEQHQRERIAPRRSPSPPPLSSIAEPPQAATMGDLELDVRVQLGSQDLYLSCLPYGKVGALFSTEQANLLVATPRTHERDDSYLVVQAFAKGARVSLQHIYSREISAMAEFSQLSILGMYRPQEPLKLAVSLRDPQLMIKLGKLYDMRTFFEIWKFYESSDKMGTPTPEPEPTPTTLRRKYSISSAKSPLSAEPPLLKKKSSDESSSCLMDRYRSAVTSVSIPWTANISITNVGAVVGMGPSIGDVNFTITRIWAAILKSSSVEQSLHAGIDMIKAQFDGRLGGTVQMDSLMAKAAIHFDEEHDSPLVHAKFRMGKVGFYFSLDFHPFIAGQVVALAVAMTTQDQTVVEDERIYVTASCESVSLVFTALVVSHTYDVITLFKRLQSQISSAPIFMAQEKPTKGPTPEAEKHLKRWGRMKNFTPKHVGIRAIFDIKVGNLLVHAFPTEFTDTVALKVFADRVSVQFDRKEAEREFVTSVDLALNECLVGLANIRGDGYSSTMMDLDYEEFLTFVRRSASGGTIVNTPEISMLMDTVEPKGRNEVRYTFSNHLFGSIEVGWNLGSVNFIKEMLETHKQAWAIRPSVNNASMKLDEEDTDSQVDETRSLQGESTLESLRERTLERSLSMSTTGTNGSGLTELSIHEEEDSGDNFGEDDNEEEVVLFGGTRYIATKPPVILIPQLRDLGDATPPIEWLGVNREKLPLFLHHLLTRKLELAAEELEEIYRKLMGQLD